MDKIDLEKLSKKELDAISAEIGQKINNITAKAVTEANLLLDRYGMACKMQIVIDSADKIMQAKHESSKPAVIDKGKGKKGRPKKSAR